MTRKRRGAEREVEWRAWVKVSDQSGRGFVMSLNKLNKFCCALTMVFLCVYGCTFRPYVYHLGLISPSFSKS